MNSRLGKNFPSVIRRLCVDYFFKKGYLLDPRSPLSSKIIASANTGKSDSATVTRLYTDGTPSQKVIRIGSDTGSMAYTLLYKTIELTH